MYIESRSVLFVYTHKETLSCTGFWLDFPRVLQQNRDEVPRLVITAKSKRKLKTNHSQIYKLKKSNENNIHRYNSRKKKLKTHHFSYKQT